MASVKSSPFLQAF